MEVDYSAMLLPKQSWKNKQSCTGATNKRRKKKIKLKKGPKHRKIKSILQDDKDKRCFLCMLLDGDYDEKKTEEHHVIYGEGKRALSDEYGLRVRLCPDHHRTDTEMAVHNNQELAERLMAIAQERFMQVFPDKDWMEIIQKNYL